MLRRPLYWVVLAAMTAAGLAIVVLPDAQAAPANQAIPPAAPSAPSAPGAPSATGSSSTDTQPPTTPTNLTRSFSCDPTQGMINTLSWTASTDNVGVTGYDVYGTTNISSTSVTLVATTTTTSYTERVNNIKFEVRARDAAGNTSDFTAPLVTPPPPSPCPTHPASPPPNHGTCAATYSPSASWPGGYQGQVTVTNTGTDTTKSWTVTLTFADGRTVTQVWGASTTSTASPYTFSSLAYDAALSPGASTTFGFLGSGNGTNTAPAVTCTRSP
jgi:hypothetical protein